MYDCNKKGVIQPDFSAKILQSFYTRRSRQRKKYSKVISIIYVLVICTHKSCV